jgi:hypothetical protein
LAAQKLILIRRKVTFFIHPADEPLDYTLLSRIELSELDSKGKTELVQVEIPLTMLKVSEVAPDVLKLLGPFGKVSSLEISNSLVLSDTASNIRRIVKLIPDIDAGKKNPEKK